MFYIVIIINIFSITKAEYDLIPKPPYIQNTWRFNLRKSSTGSTMFQPAPRSMSARRRDIDGNVFSEYPYQLLLDLHGFFGFWDWPAGAGHEFWDWAKSAIPNCDDSVCDKRCAFGCSDTDPSGNCATGAYPSIPFAGVSYLCHQ